MRRKTSTVGMVLALLAIAFVAGVYGIALFLRAGMDLVRLVFGIPPKRERDQDVG